MSHDTKAPRRTPVANHLLSRMKRPLGRGSLSRDSHTGNPGSPSLIAGRLPGMPILWFALLATLCLGLLFALNNGLVRAQSADQFFTYTENSPDPVGTFTSSDPEGATPGYWSLVTDAAVSADIDAADIADQALFKIDQNGVLSFRTPRSYEADSADTTNPKQYRVTVQVSDGSEVEYFKAYVTVTDIEETGKVTWTVAPGGTALTPPGSLQQFQPGAVLTPTVTDPDGPATITPTAWKWYRGSSVISGQTGATYTVVAADVDNHIRVEATYTDDNGGPAETVRFTSPHPVQAAAQPGTNNAPVFSPTTVTRRVEENSKGNVGGPVTATDSNGDRLTYTLGGTDATSFKIDAATGQLMVGNGVTINYEVDDEYEVTVTATDSSGTVAGAAATVTINVIDVDEKPTFDTGSVAAGVLMAQTEGRTAIDGDNDTSTTGDDVTLVASDPDGKKVTLSLMGNDAGSFELADDTDTGNGVSQVLSFKEKTDFEMPGDRNRDNVYEVTVRASDGTLNADRMLIIKVINDANESGKVTVSPADAAVGVELTATLAHMEGSVSASGQVANLKWQWQTADAPTGAGETCAANAIWPSDTAPATPGNIAGATKAAYTPVFGNAGDCLRATATYNYQFAVDATTASSAGTEVLVSQVNQAPKFKEGASTFRVVAENVAANAADDATADAGTTDPATNDNVGSPIEATDANGDTVTYTLGGSSASLFRVRDNGQLEVKGKLDHEKSHSHTVTLTANDGSGASNDRATITVTIYVTDVDEAPVIKDRADSTADGMRTTQYTENSPSPVARFTASDPERATPVYWSLTSAAVADVIATDIADRALFKIDQNGVLSFRTPRSYEADSDSGDKNYQVTVQASNGNGNGYFELTVAVTDIEETGKVTWTVAPGGTALTPPGSLQQFQPGAVLTPTVTDPDGPATITPTAWKWYRGSSVISGQTGATYTVVAADVDNHIRVEATYTDDNGGPAETVRFTSPHPVQAAAQPGTNNAPVFSPTTVTRRVEENSKGNVGGPVTATDSNGDRLTYTLGGTDATSFKIDAATGQLMVGNGVTINYEVDDEYEVTVTATDSSGTVAGAAATVTINVIDVDEKPTFDTGSVAAGVLMAQTEGRTAIDGDNDTSTTGDDVTLVASDPDGKKVTLSLMGNDAGSFELADDTDTGNGVSQVLSFKEKTDFEMPGDRNRDNVYEVTVRASDGTLNADRMLIIKVINDANESGKVTVSPADAAVGVELTATLAHMEGSVSASGQVANLKWQWQTADAPTGAGETCAANAIWPSDTAPATPGNIAGATKAAYTPVFGNAGDCLRATATYNYQFAVDATTASSAGTEVLVSQVNQAPKFKEGASTFRVVAENVAANAADDATADAGTTDPATNDNVGSPIEATDANGDTVTYTLGGSSASLFRVRDNGQLEVKGKLDHEKSHSHTVTLTANDGSGASNDSATITVTIYVTDVDEAPVISTGGLVVSGRSSVGVDEGETAVGTYTAAGPDAADAMFTLSGADANLFSIPGAGGELTFKIAPDFETGGDNTYQVTVVANDGTLTASKDVTVNVIDVDEAGMVTLSAATPAVDVMLTATLTDPDASQAQIDAATWVWEREQSAGQYTIISGATSATYTPVTADVGNHLRVTASYTDGDFGSESEAKRSDNAVTAGDPLLARYDVDGDGIEKSEVIAAINDYLDGGEGAPTKADVIRLINLYLDS